MTLNVQIFYMNFIRDFFFFLMIESDHLLVVSAINVSQNATLGVAQSNTIQGNWQDSVRK